MEHKPLQKKQKPDVIDVVCFPPEVMQIILDFLGTYADQPNQGPGAALYHAFANSQINMTHEINGQKNHVPGIPDYLYRLLDSSLLYEGKTAESLFPDVTRRLIRAAAIMVKGANISHPPLKEDVVEDTPITPDHSWDKEVS